MLLLDDKTTVFAGECAEPVFLSPLRRRHGEALYDTMRSYVGKTGDQLAGLFQGRADPL